MCRGSSDQVRFNVAMYWEKSREMVLLLAYGVSCFEILNTPIFISTLWLR